MKRFSRWFINGLITLLPITITIYATYWIASACESIFGATLRKLLGMRGDGGIYFTGMGVIVMVASLIVVGFFMEFYLGKWAMGLSERILAKIPGIRQLYASIKEIIDFFNPEKRLNSGNYMVIVTLSPEITALGYVTRDGLDTLKGGLGTKDQVVVILPFCYQMGGNTIIVPRERVRPVDMTFEEGMKLALSGFVLTSEGHVKPAPKA